MLTDKLLDIVRRGMQRKLIAGTISLRKTAPDAAALFVNDQSLDNFDPMMPYFPGNCADFIKKLTKIEPTENKILAILRPCEMRAAVELTKLAQIQNKNIIWLSYDCYGTIARKDIRNRELPSGDEFYANFESKYAGETRPVCQSCDIIRADTADIGFLAFEENAPFIAYTETGRNFLASLDVQFIDKAQDTVYRKIIDAKMQNKSSLYKKLSNNVRGIDNLLSFFAHCINCHNCMSNCPICICRECFFESEALDFEGDVFIDLAARKGGLRAPTDVMLFHLGRMSHMATSCIACGACEEACPESIPIGQIFKLVSENVQSDFQYKAGRCWDEELPLKTFREEELQPR